MVLTASIDEALYYSLWREPRGKCKCAMPSVVPQAVIARPEIMPWQGVLSARPVYLQPVMKERKLHAPIVDHPAKMLRSSRSDALGPNCYVFAGEVVASDRYGIAIPGVEHPQWRMDFILDCGVPLHFGSDHTPHTDPTGCLENYFYDGAYLEGIAHISTASLPTLGIHQPAAGKLLRMHELDLDCNSETFGRLRELAFGDRLTEDPDVLTVDAVFATFEIETAGQLAYSPFPARTEDSPEPRYEGMLRKS